MPSTSERFPPAARGVIPAGPGVTSHIDGWNQAVDVALGESFSSRDSDNTYQVTFTLSATVVEGDNPGRITEYIATGV
jgi:hypothetical protein